MMHMGHRNHMAQSVSHWDPCSAVCGCCSEVMQLFQNLNFFKTRYSNGCSFFNVKARIMKLWQLKVLKSGQNHSFMWFFDLLSEKSSNLVKHLGESRAGKSHITAMWTQIQLFRLDLVKRHKKMLFKAHLFGTLFLIYSPYSQKHHFFFFNLEPWRRYLSKTNNFWWLLGHFWGPLGIKENIFGLFRPLLVF